MKKLLTPLCASTIYEQQKHTATMSVLWIRNGRGILPSSGSH